MNIPILDLQRQYESIRDELDAAILGVARSGRYILGPRVKEFEDAAAAYCGCKHAIGVASGTDALLLSLKALDIGPGDAVILPSFTFFATAGVVHNVGATPVFCDIDPRTFNLDTNSLRSVLAGRDAAGGSWPVARGGHADAQAAKDTSTGYMPQATGSALRFRAIIPVHLYGQMADMEEILSIAREYELAVVEDAAQAIGATYSRPLNELHEPNEPHEPKKAGTLGDLGCFSFYPTKNLGAYGDGGMVTTNDDALAEAVRMLRVHGAKPKYYHHRVGVNSRLDAIQAAILGVKLRHLDDWSAARRHVADRYDDALSSVDRVAAPARIDGRSHIFHQYTVRIENGRRDMVRDSLTAAGIGTMIYYPVPLHLQECFAYLGYKEGELPASERACGDVLSLPIFPELREEEQSAVVDAIRAAA